MASGKRAGIAKSRSFALFAGFLPPFQRLAAAGKSKTQNPKPKSLNAKPKILSPKPKILDPKPKILNAKRPPAPVRRLGKWPSERSRHCKIDKLCAFVGFFPFMSTARSGRKRPPRPKFNPEPFATQKPKSKTQKPKSKTQKPKSKTQNPKPKIQNPKPKIQNPKAQHPKSKNQKVLNVKWPPRAGNPRRLKLPDRCRQRVAQADSLLLRRLMEH